MRSAEAPRAEDGAGAAGMACLIETSERRRRVVAMSECSVHAHALPVDM